MKIRRERPEEFGQIYELVKVAFQTAKVSDGNEQEFVNELRSGGNYIPELALVAEKDGKLIGHIMLTKTYILHSEEEASQKHEVLLMAPVSVALAYRDRGVGSQMIRESFRLAAEMGYRSIFLVGDPAYYQRFGFRSSTDFDIRSKSGIPDQFVMAYEIVPGTLKDISGTLDCC